ncbi:MAG: alpha-L-arabinofuranosidase C-terminal domain-containing protein [Acidobacteriota bacterium]
MPFHHSFGRRLQILGGATLMLFVLGGRGACHRAAAAPQTAPPASSIPNGSFEAVEGDRPAGWRTATFQRAAEFAVDAIAHSGTRSVRISSRDGTDAGWTVRVEVRPYARYRLSAWIKTDNVDAGTGAGALLNLHGLGRMHTEAVTGTTDWTQVSLEFETEANDGLQVNCLLGGWGRSRGTAWYDDVELVMLSARELRPAVVIDAGSRRPPISKYIYGQFIEHLGRCIYGGIWAEMLEDRKFFYPVGARESPWTIEGDPRSVAMRRVDAYVGEHSPEFVVGPGAQGGIGQSGLALAAGSSYTGRIVLAGDGSGTPVDVSLVWGPAPAERETVTVRGVRRAFRTFALSFTARETAADGRLLITSRGEGPVRVGAVSLMPADHVEGFRPDVLRLLRELNAPVYRWPGGNFVSGYDWRDGVGDRDRRPPRKNPAWQGIEHNDVGIHEFMALCRLIDAEPYIAVNSGLGDARSAADQVEYVNGAASTPMGRQREANGHPEPFRCRWWSVGNEMYGNWQLGHVPLADYVKRHAEFALAMRGKDPSIALVAVGAVGTWDEAMLAGNAASMDLISEHFYVQEGVGLMGHVAQVPRAIRRIASAHRRYRETIPALAGRDIRIALDEWNYWYGPHLYGELGTRYYLKDALGIAAGIHEYARQSDIIFMANYAQTVNVIGAIKTTKTAAAFDTTGLVLKLYRARFGQIPVEVGGAPEPLDVAAAWRGDGSALTLAVVNPTRDEQSLALQLTGGEFRPDATLWRIAGEDERAFNEPGKAPAVSVVESRGIPLGSTLLVPPMSISLYEVAVTTDRPATSRPGSGLPDVARPPAAGLRRGG